MRETKIPEIEILILEGFFIKRYLDGSLETTGIPVPKLQSQLMGAQKLFQMNYSIQY